MSKRTTTAKKPAPWKTWEEVEAAHFTPQQIAKAKAYAEREVLKMNLRELRAFLGKTQVEVSRITKIAQPELSRLERREDHLLSTLRSYVEALGGEVEVLARFDGKTIRLQGV